MSTRLFSNVAESWLKSRTNYTKSIISHRIDTSDPWLMFNGDIIPALGVMAFAFMCHHNTFLVYQNLQNASLSTWQRITHWSVGFALIISSAFGVAGYLTFRGSSQGDLLENYCWDDDLMNLCRIVFSTAILLAFPIECIIAREVRWIISSS